MMEIFGIPYLKTGGIHIKKKNRGKFTASAKAAEQSVQEHARSVLNNPNATPLQKKRANFARNSAKWHKHQQGGSFVRKFAKKISDDPRYDGLPGLQVPFGEYNGGQSGGAGARTIITDSPNYTWVEKRDTLWLPVEQSFNEAFTKARKQGLKTFQFNGKLFNTEMGNNPNSQTAGARRFEMLGLIPIEIKKRYKTEQNKKQ